MKQGLILIGLVFEIALLLSLFVYIGNKLDAYFQTKGACLFTLITLAFLLWFYQLIKLCKNINQ